MFHISKCQFCLDVHVDGILIGTLIYIVNACNIKDCGRGDITVILSNTCAGGLTMFATIA